MKKYLIIGSGFSGAVVAEQLSKNPDNKILILEERNHIGGNCYTERDKETNIMVHKYGPHIFNTDNEEIWDYIQNFCEMIPFVNRVKSIYKSEVYSLPINLHTINQFFKKNLNPREAKLFIENIAQKNIVEPQNFEEQALKFIGKDLYEAFFYGYTKKTMGLRTLRIASKYFKKITC